MHARPIVIAALLALSLPAAALTGAVADGAAGSTSQDAPNACVGTMERQPDEPTLVSIQGARVTPDGYEKKPALLVSYAPDGSFLWARNASLHGRWWAYDVDRTPDGDLLFLTTESSATVAGELDPEDNEYEWRHHLDGSPDDDADTKVIDAHDADRLNDEEIVVADKGAGHERILVYDVTRGAVVWEWRFEDHPDEFPRDGGGPGDDWTHLNDVDPVGEDLFMISVRNFDQVAFINRTTGDVETTLGEDGNHDVLHRQHNPDHLRGPDGEHTVLIADSLNDRVVEYEYDEGSDEWERVWTVTGLDEPRDADRLPDGNTLITDRMGHRTLEVTPEGRVVWEVYTPYEPYDVERGGPGSEGPTMRERGAEGSVELHNQADFDTEDVEDCAAATYEFAPSRLDQLVSWATGDDAHRDDDATVEDDGSDSAGDGSGAEGGDGGANDGDSDGLFGSIPPIVPIALAGGLIAALIAVGAAYRRR